ncbi:MAG TPA: NAD(P)/FAD-dependent oxidoreductase, partial [Kofleriaceae bacterium]|nr:NAD(P)/FAD-dependent oxidoreductase [Kofleriaceae bacterium]
MSIDEHVDVVVVGAGSTGAAAAAFLAEAGARVIVVERRRLDEAGARWVNGVPLAAYREAGLEPPSAPELRGGPSPMYLTSPSGARVVIDGHEVVEIDMRHLVARLQARARSAGARLVGETRVIEVTEDGVTTSAGVVRARWIVDASGVAGARLLGQPSPAREDLCAAAQEVREVRDPDAARAFFAAHGVPAGGVLGMVGGAGGFSVVDVHLSHDAREISILTGSLPALGFPSGKALLERFVAEHPWIGATIFGGSGAIPLRRAYDRIASERIALVGDAACQVFPAHGSGVGSGMIAARLLADTIASGRSLREYERAWQARRGGLHATYDVLRRWNATLAPDQIERLLASGALDPVLARAGLDQRLPELDVRALARQARALAREPSLR